MNRIEIRLFALDSYILGKTVTLVVSLHNTGDKTLLVPQKPFLHGAPAYDCLSVNIGKKRAAYDGIRLKNTAHGTHALLALAPGATHYVPLEISAAYPVSEKGKYTVRFKPGGIPCLPDNKSRKWARKGILQVQSFPVSFIVVGGRRPRLTLRQFAGKMKAGGKLLKGPAPAAFQRLTIQEELSPAGCVFNGGDASQQALVASAHHDAFNLSVNALYQLKNSPNDANYLQWFGAPDATRLSGLVDSFSRMVNQFKNSTFTYNLAPQDCNGQIGSAEPGNLVISLCAPFWKLPVSGVTSQAGRLVHEHSHVSAGTIDDQYGTDYCMLLAQRDPGTAVCNADSYEFYAGGYPLNQ